MIYLVDNNNNSMVSICTAMTIDLDLSDEIDPVRWKRTCLSDLSPWHTLLRHYIP